MNPYQDLSEKYFWSTAVAKRNMYDIEDLWSPKFRINKAMKVATFGSCFAQHIGNALGSRGFNWFISETAPIGLSPDKAKKFNYGIFSARTGNIYTVSLLKQWIEWACNEKQVPEEIWEKDCRFYDPFRPNIEPDGFESKEELIESRKIAIESFRRTLTDAHVFVFTLGLTESWFNSENGYEYPMCPGTIAGTFDEIKHRFLNQDLLFVRKNLTEAIRKIRSLNPKIKFILTVSPVPLTASMSGNHVLVATTYSKSVLRAVAGMLQEQFNFIDYFPSYEIINTTPYRGTFFEVNQRNVNHKGVDHVMNIFFDSLKNKFKNEEDEPNKNIEKKHNLQIRRQERIQSDSLQNAVDDLVCEEELLNAFSKK
jgi:hypothetical protein